MRRFGMTALWLLAGLAVAEARPYHHAHHHYRHSPHHYMHIAHGNLSGACASAAAQGGPCGCWTQERLLGTSARLVNGHNLWLAAEWRAVFPHVAAAAGTAAVWPNGHHVAPVVAVNGDGTVTVQDSWATHRVRMAGLTFVDPHGGGTMEAGHDERHYATRRHTHYALRRHLHYASR